MAKATTNGNAAPKDQKYNIIVVSSTVSTNGDYWAPATLCHHTRRWELCARASQC